MLADPTFLAAAVAAVLVAGVSKGGFGSGVAFAATPILALVVSPAVAVAVMLPALCVMDLAGVWAYRGRWDWPNARALVLSAALGVGLGALMFDFVSEAALKLALGLIALFFVGWRALQVRPEALTPAWWRAPVFGCLAGFSSVIAHAGGPLVAMHLVPQKLPKLTYQATTVFFFWAINVIKLPTYAALGLFTADTLTASALLAPLAIAATRLGVYAHKRVSEALYYRLILGFVAIIGVKLVYDGGAALL